jgi:opacity protein-like surface antigen
MKKTSALLIGIVGIAAARTARADDQTTQNTTVTTDPDQTVTVTTWNEPSMASGIGIGFQLGGGAAGFFDPDMRGIAGDTAGNWAFRAAFGTHTPLGVEANYLGTDARLRDLGANGDSGGRLVGTTLEGDLRLNLGPHDSWDPYVFAGVGWQRFDASHVVTVSDTGLHSNANVTEVPAGVGLSYRDLDGLTFDLRGTFRQPVTDADLFTTQSGDKASLRSWEAGAAIGYEF